MGSPFREAPTGPRATMSILPIVPIVPIIWIIGAAASIIRLDGTSQASSQK